MLKRFPDLPPEAANTILLRPNEVIQDPGEYRLTFASGPSARAVRIRLFRFFTLPQPTWVDEGDSFTVPLGGFVDFPGPAGGPVFPLNAVRYARRPQLDPWGQPMRTADAGVAASFGFMSRVVATPAAVPPDTPPSSVSVSNAVFVYLESAGMPGAYTFGLSLRRIETARSVVTKGSVVGKVPALVVMQPGTVTATGFRPLDPVTLSLRGGTQAVWTTQVTSGHNLGVPDSGSDPAVVSAPNAPTTYFVKWGDDTGAYTTTLDLNPSL